MKRLIVNADDFGRSPAVNRGIIRAHERGIVTSASLMVRWPDAPVAAELAHAHPKLSVGLHVDLGEWLYRGDRWLSSYHVVSLTSESALAAEVERQLTRFRDLLGRNPTHIDSHQHVHRRRLVAAVLTRAARELEIPLRGATPSIRYCGAFFGQTPKGEPLHVNVTVSALLTLLEQLEPGVTELSCHPASDDDGWSVYGIERTYELHVLCDARIRQAVAQHDIELCSFHSLAAERLTETASKTA